MKAVDVNKLVACVGVVLLTAPLFGENHVSLDSRPLAAETKLQMQENRLAELQEFEIQDLNKDAPIARRPLPVPPLVPPMPHSEDSNEAKAIPTSSANPIIPIKTQRLAFLTSDQMMRTATSSYTPNLYHWIDSLPYDNVIKLEDGSEWTFNLADSFKVRSWRRGDTLVLSPKMHWFWGSDYSYCLMNKTLNSFVEVNPTDQGPVEYGTYSTWIVGIDYNNCQVHLVNGQGEKSTWVISNADLYLFKDWKLNDHVIIGDNDNWIWWFSPFNHVIFNVNMNHNVRVRHL